MAKERIAYVDFMKGLCIIIIAIGHVEENYFDSLLPNLNFALKSYRIPMYFFLSGLFFKTYSGFNEFLRKKVNNLIVTLFFFHFLCCFLKLPLLAYVTFFKPDVDIHFSLIDIIPPLFGRYWRSAGALWFLEALFVVNIIYYLFHKYLNHIGVAIAVILSSMVGYLLMRYKVELPCLLDIALVGLPFFMLGSLVKHYNLLKPSRFDKWGLVVMIPCMFLIYNFSADINFLYQNVPNYFKLYAIPFIAILSLFWCSKNLQYVPLICYYGRYSIVVLGTHQVLITYSWYAMWSYFSDFGWQNLIILTFVIVMFLELFIIQLMIKYFPRFTAQKEFFMPGWRINYQRL
jgi:fucose 4-O-acetylase-like acetyltransferase